ncbi:MAG: Maf-like protein, partial [Lachnospiraceae bacterium]|nr:Maf-like protein [Lachnospiraceae bacterium]
MNVLILASASPRRREILANARIPFIVMTQETSETLPESVRTPEDTVRYLSFRKAEAAAERILSGQEEAGSAGPDGCIFVLGADTIVASDGMILGKPADEEDAYRMLKRLSGRQHDVFTGVTILKIAERRVCARDTFFEKTAVFVEPMPDREIRWY